MKNNLTILDNDYDPFFDFFAPEIRPQHHYKALNMRTDIQDLGEQYKIDIEIPGVRKEDINLTLKDGYLTVEVKVNNSNNETKDKFIHRERYFASSSRSYYVGDIKQSDVDARYSDGILTLTFPKDVHKKVEEEKISIK